MLLEVLFEFSLLSFCLPSFIFLGYHKAMMSQSILVQIATAQNYTINYTYV